MIDYHFIKEAGEGTLFISAASVLGALWVLRKWVLNYLCGWTFLSSTKYWPLPFHGTGGFELDELVILALFSYTTDWLWKPVYSSLIQWVIVLWVQPSHSIWGDLLRFLVCLHPHAHTQLKVFLILWTEIRPLKFPSFPIYYVEKKYIV